MEDISEHPLEPEATPLYYSAACGYPNLIERLIAIYPNDVNPREGGWAPMYVAVTMGHLDVARVLLEHGACVDFRTGDWTLLHFASSKPDLDAIQLLLLEHGADADCRDDLDQTPLHLASHVGCPKTMRQLLQHGADTNNRMLSSRTPLYQAVRSGNLEAVRLLLQYGANVNDKDDLSRTALHVSSSPEITLALLECGADVNARDKFGNRPLEIATEFGYHDIAQLLLKHCAREVIESNRGIQVVMAYGYLFPRPHIFVP
jgi:ankyrin repeat protein